MARRGAGRFKTGDADAEIRHDSVYLYGAICPARGVGAAVIMPAANTEGMTQHLKEISTQIAPPQIAPGAHAALICDGAGWHQRGKKLSVPDNITLLPLPPYAPALNSMENVWEYLRSHKLCVLVWTSYDDILAACKRAWDFLITDPDRIRSIGTRDFLIVDRGPAHRAKKTKAFIETLGGRLKLFFLPPYSPDRNPDELVWKHVKADTVGRVVVMGKADFRTKVISSLRSLQRNSGKICSFFQKPSLQYAA